jgi:hypothetical protein
MEFECRKTENCFSDSQTWEYRLQETAEDFEKRLEGWKVEENRRFRRPMMTAERGEVKLKGILASGVIRVSFPDTAWQKEKAAFEEWLGEERA